MAFDQADDTGLVRLAAEVLFHREPTASERKVLAAIWDTAYRRGAYEAEADMEPMDNPFAPAPVSRQTETTEG